MDTYNISKSLCESLDIEFDEKCCQTDDELLKIPPYDELITIPSFPSMRGENHHLYKKSRSEEVKKKISNSRKGQKLKSWTEERRRKTIASLKETMKGKKPSQKMIEAARNANKGRKNSPETIEKMRESQRRRHMMKK